MTVYVASASLADKKESRAITWRLAEKLAEKAGLKPGGIRYLSEGEKAGKPVFEKEGFVSASHTGGRLFVAVSDGPVGIDAEKRRDVSAAVREKYYTKWEKKEDFFSVWTGKEAVAKLDGRGLSVIRQVRTWRDCATFDGKIYYLEAWNEGDVVITVATPEAAEISRQPETAPRRARRG